MKASVIIPTHNRPEKLARLIDCLRQQDLTAKEYEIIVVDDNSTPPVELQKTELDPRTSVVRLSEAERSTARNTGARAALGEIVIFVDDDMTVEASFISEHLRFHKTYPGALVVGSVRLPQHALETPFGRFRQRLENSCVPDSGGPVLMDNFCTAANMSIAREWFLDINGFDPAIISSEDQDFALRHTIRGGKIAFAPRAAAIHWDESLDIRRYCNRSEWGSRNMIPFCLRYPERVENQERLRINSRSRFGQEPLLQSLRKTIKTILCLRPIQSLLFAFASFLEGLAPDSAALDRTYRLVLGAHICRGFRAGLELSLSSDQVRARNNLTRESYIEADR